jgi:hypothetical protein
LGQTIFTSPPFLTANGTDLISTRINTSFESTINTTSYLVGVLAPTTSTDQIAPTGPRSFCLDIAIKACYTYGHPLTSQPPFPTPFRDSTLETRRIHRTSSKIRSTRCRMLPSHHLPFRL